MYIKTITPLSLSPSQTDTHTHPPHHTPLIWSLIIFDLSMFAKSLTLYSALLLANYYLSHFIYNNAMRLGFKHEQISH